MKDTEEKVVLIEGEAQEGQAPEARISEKGEDSSRHHHHHHHHHHHKRRHRSKKSKLKSLFKKNKRVVQIVSFILCMAIVSSIAVFTDRAVSYKGNGTRPENSEEEIIGNLQENLIYVGLPTFSERIEISSDIARKYLENDVSVNISAFMKGVKTTERLDIGKAVELKFDIFGLDKSSKLNSTKLEISESRDFTNSLYYDLNDDFTVKVWNLKTDTDYFYKLHLKLENGRNLVYQGSFETAKSPRFLNIQSIGNARDIGGWTTVDGKTIKQGLLFRGTELDGAVESAYKLTESGVSEMVTRLGIKYDMDLRESTDMVPGEYILGSSVTHKYYSAPMYGAAFDNSGKNSIRKIFSDLADKNNYPMYIHCTYGRDRTGTVCYILEALLGLSEKDLIKEYELSGLFYGGVNRSDIMTVYGGLLSYEGATIQQKTENYLLSIGVTKQEIESIKSILLQ